MNQDALRLDQSSPFLISHPTTNQPHTHPKTTYTSLFGQRDANTSSQRILGHSHCRVYRRVKRCKRKKLYNFLCADEHPVPPSGPSVLDAPAGANSHSSLSFRSTLMASTTIIAQSQPPTTTSSSNSGTVTLGRSLSYSSTNAAYENGATQSTASAKTPPPPNSRMSFTTSQGSQNSGLMLHPGSSFRQYGDANGAQQNGAGPQIYSVSSSPIPSPLF